VPLTTSSLPFKKILNLLAWAAMSGMPRPVTLHQVQSTNRVDRVKEANALVKAFIPAAEVPEEDGHGFVLVGRSLKVVREAAAGDFRCLLLVEARRSADGGDIGTCQSVAM